ELPEEQMRDKLELSFCKSRNGGGEVETVEYNKQSQSAVITFVEAGGIFSNIQKNGASDRNRRRSDG
uniref:Nucleolin n=1 Tax=Nannospalax galili TaxID=1026970 RepID=A0A8C6R3F2_NANGA